MRGRRRAHAAFRRDPARPRRARRARADRRTRCARDGGEIRVARRRARMVAPALRGVEGAPCGSGVDHGAPHRGTACAGSNRRAERRVTGRDLLKASTCALAGLPLLARATELAAPSSQTRFDYAALKGQARALAAAPYAAPPKTVPPAVAHLKWDGFQSIRFRPERALWAGASLGFELQFFHLGMQFRRPVRMHEVVDGVAREIAYDPSMFALSKSGLDPAALPRDLGFAGFRVCAAPDFTRDVAAFLGASYFRAVGGTLQYGLSARGLAVDCGLQRPEEFPD